MTVIPARASVTGGPSRRKLFPHRAIGGLGLVRSIKEQRVAAGAVRMGADPRILVGKSPGLDRRTARVVQARPDDAAIDLGLARQVLGLRHAAGIQRQRDVQLRDVNLQA